jgi:hypothetical protein
MTTKPLYTLTDEHKAQLAPWADRWIANALNTSAMDADDRAAMVVAMDGLYRAANLEPPTRQVFHSGPISGAFAASIAGGIWWLRANQDTHAELFGRQLTEAELVGSIASACTTALRPCGVPDATIAATIAATRAATDAAPTEDIADCPPSLLRFLMLCCRHWHRLRNAGNQWSGWVCYLAFFRHIAKLDLDYSKWQHYEAAAIHGGVRFMHAKFWIVCDRPEWIYRGWDLYYVHGIPVPREWVDNRATLDPQMALTHDNVEQRRALVALIGWERILQACEVKTIHSDSWGELLEASVGDNEGLSARFVRVVCPSSGRVYVNRVPPDVTTPRHGLGWRHFPAFLLADPDSAREVPVDWYAPELES